MSLVSYGSSSSDSESDTKSEKALNKRSAKKRIKIPAIPNYDSDEEPAHKILKISNQSKSSDLFSVLPKPKYKPKDRPSQKDIKFDAAVVQKNNLVPRMVKTGKPEVDDDDGNFFFIAPNEKKTRSVSKPLIISEVNSAKPVSSKTNSYFSNLVSKKTAVNINKPSTAVKVVDINSEEFKKDWRLTALKQETSTINSEPKEVEPSNLSKKKHQISYLAYQAKKNEEKLKNQWALNKISRQQTQARYGF